MIILDLDNCISDDRHRRHHIDHFFASGEAGKHAIPPEAWHDYHSLSAFDVAYNSWLWRSTGAPIYIFTGRPKAYEAVTREWLRRAGIPVRLLAMRANNDFRPASEVKETMLLTHIEDITAIELAVDDVPDICEMYRARGVRRVQRVFIHP